jgi:hypothetical protein
MKSEQKPHSFADVLDGTVDPAVLAQLEAGHPIYYVDDELDSIVEERPDGTIWRVILGPGGAIAYLDQEPARSVDDPSL